MYVCSNKPNIKPCCAFETRVLKNTYPVHTEHALQFRVLRVQRVSRLVAGILHCTALSAYMHNIKAVVAQELNSSLAQRVRCAVKAHMKIFRGQGDLCVLFGKA